MQNFQFTYNAENLGELTVSHKERTKLADIMSVSSSKKEILSVTVPFETKPANVLKLIFDAIDSLDYNG